MIATTPYAISVTLLFGSWVYSMLSTTSLASAVILAISFCSVGASSALSTSPTKASYAFLVLSDG